jgi:hypothetical protein
MGAQKGHQNWHKAGFKLTDEWKRKIGLANKGKKRKFTDEHKKNISISHSGERAYQWKGGVMKNKDYVSWLKNKRNRVLKRLKIDGLTHTFGEWEILKKQYGYTCPHCGKSEPEIKLTEDHIIPLSKGGSDLIENIQPLCGTCNSIKGTKIC